MKKYSLLILLLCGIVCLAGCDKKESTEKVKTVDYTVVPSEDIPEDLLEIIEPRKEVPFQLTFSDQSYLYIIKGYGKQDTGGYNIVVNDFYQTKDGLYLDTELFGPAADETVDGRISYPYIVIKTELIDLPVTFSS
ncbi:MAG: protease complex subunit PrcB family protein [Eubacteriales bacterium]|nr:protease complex subunit PrcB family protein [Eubacteriales bacterium]